MIFPADRCFTVLHQSFSSFEVPAEDSTAQPVQPEPEEDDEDFDFDEFDVDAGEFENMYE